MLEKLKQEVWKACEMLPAQGLAILTWGNVSGIDREAGAIAIKPSGVDYRTMTPEDIVIVALDGTVLEGTLHPSSDLKTHLDLYNAWPQIGAIVHTHSKYATIQSQAGLDLQPFGTTHADTFYGPVPCTRLLRDEEIQGDYEKATGDVILETFQERSLIRWPCRRFWSTAMDPLPGQIPRCTRWKRPWCWSSAPKWPSWTICSVRGMAPSASLCWTGTISASTAPMPPMASTETDRPGH